MISRLLLLCVAACASARTADVTYAVSPERNYELGKQSLAREDWEAAEKYFVYIKSRAAFSQYAVPAELGVADAQFGAGRYVEAIDSYRLFSKLHPTHAQVEDGYAAFRVGDAYYRMLPSKIPLYPPTSEYDQTSMMDASEELQRFVNKFPQSPYLTQATDLKTKISRRVANHEWYVAMYYWKRNKPLGTVGRLRRILDKHRGVGYDEDALLYLGRAYAKAGAPDRARESWSELVAAFPASQQAKAAKDGLAQLAGGAQ